MVFNPSVPLNSDSPSIFPQQNQDNMSRLQAIVGADHQFNLAADANDGYHNLVHMTIQAPAGALADTGRLYAKSSAGRVHAFYMDSSGDAYQISPTMPIRAAVNFNGIAGAVIRGTAYNVASVSHDGTGTYTITFTNSMPDNNYIVLATAMSNAPGIATASVVGDATYSNSVQTGLVKVSTYDKNGNIKDALMVNVVIMSVT